MRCRLIIYLLYFLSTSMVCGLILYMLYANIRKNFFFPDINAKVDDLTKMVKGLCAEIEVLKKPCKTPGSSCNPALIEASVTKHAEDLRKEISEQKEIVNHINTRCQKDGLDMYRPQEDLRTNYALETLGASIAYVEDKPYHKECFVLRMFGYQTLSNMPANVLNPSIYPGSCYAYQGTKSVIIIKLSKRIYIDSVSITHISEAISPTGEITSAPKTFAVFGLHSVKDPTGYNFGSFSYNIHIRKEQQVFKFLKLAPEPFRYVKFNFTSNNGNPTWSCIYKIGVHGRI